MGKVFDPSLIFEFIPTLLKYLVVTLEILGASILLGTIIGIVAAIPKLFHIPILKQIVTLYISFIRGTPIIIQLFLVYYGLPAALSLINIDITRMDAFFFVVVTYSLSNGAIFAEIFRGAITAVEFGQSEAAYSIGMNPFQNFTRIIFPQAIRIAFPNIANTVIGSLKDTSLAFTIGLMDMMGRGETLISATAHALEVYIALSIIYYIIVLILEKGFKVFEKYTNRYQGTSATVA